MPNMIDRKFTAFATYVARGREFRGTMNEAAKDPNPSRGEWARLILDVLQAFEECENHGEIIEEAKACFDDFDSQGVWELLGFKLPHTIFDSFIEMHGEKEVHEGVWNHKQHGPQTYPAEIHSEYRFLREVEKKGANGQITKVLVDLASPPKDAWWGDPESPERLNMWWFFDRVPADTYSIVGIPEIVVVITNMVRWTNEINVTKKQMEDPGNENYRGYNLEKLKKKTGQLIQGRRQLARFILANAKGRVWSWQAMAFHEQAMDEFHTKGLTGDAKALKVKTSVQVIYDMYSRDASEMEEDEHFLAFQKWFNTNEEDRDLEVLVGLTEGLTRDAFPPCKAFFTQMGTRLYQEIKNVRQGRPWNDDGNALNEEAQAVLDEANAKDKEMKDNRAARRAARIANRS